MNPFTEYREIVKIDYNIKLTKEDILKLADIVTYGIEDYHNSIELNFKYKNKILKFKSKDELELNFPSDFPNEIEYINFEISDWKSIDMSSEKDIVGGISITIHRIFIEFQIHSIDETWFLGIRSKLLSFFEDKKRPFSYLNSIVSYLSGFLFIISPILIIYFFKQNMIVYSGIFIILAAISGIVIKKSLYGVSSIQTKFILEDKKYDYTKTILDISSVLGAIFGGISLIIELIKLLK